MVYWYLRIRNWLSDQKGQDLAEYALLLALIVIGAVVAVEALGGGIQNVLERVAGELGNALD